MSDVKSLYETDLVAWSKEQAEGLRAVARGGTNQPLDWENLAEEIEDLGASQRAALQSQLRRIIEHFLKLEYSPARDPRRSWRSSIVDARIEVEVLLERNPSLAREAGAMAAAEHPRAARKAIADLEEHGELSPSALPRIRSTCYTADQIIGDWFPPDPLP